MACKTANHTPPGVLWARLLQGEVGSYPNVVRQTLPVLCMHCEEPSCMEVCPTGATQKLDNGIVIVEKDKCMGCKYCVMACPYGARYSVEEWESYFPDGLPLSPYEQFAKKAKLVPPNIKALQLGVDAMATTGTNLLRAGTVSRMYCREF